MNGVTPVNSTHRGRAIRVMILLLLLCAAMLLRASESLAAPVSTPLQQSGLIPLWQENFTNGSIDRMQYTWTKGNNSVLTSYVMPGAVYLGKNGTLDLVEQEINNFKANSTEPIALTLEFDVLSPNTGQGRISLRPRRRGDMVTIWLGQANNRTKVSFREDEFDIVYNELTGPSYGWTHVVESYRQFVQNGTTYAQMVVAVNEEVHEHQSPSGIINPNYATYWANSSTADGWSIEHASSEVLMGKYIANVRAYSGFLSMAELQARLAGRVSAYRASLPDPTKYTGPTKAFQVHKTLLSHGPNAMAYPAKTGNLTFNFDGSLSSDWNKITSYAWSFGDGQSGSGRFVNHTYAQPGTYNATLVVTSASGTDAHTISVTAGGGATATNTPQPTATSAPQATATSTPKPTPTPTLSPANLLANPGFELDNDGNNSPDSWTLSPRFTRSNAVVHGGSYAGRFQATTDANPTVAQRVSRLGAGTTYNFSGWVNIPITTDAFTFQIQVRWLDSANAVISTATVKTYSGPTVGWDQATASLVSPAGTAKADVWMVVTSLNATIYVDDFSFGR